MLCRLVLTHWSCICVLSNVNSASASKRIRYNMEHGSPTQMPEPSPTQPIAISFSFKEYIYWNMETSPPRFSAELIHLDLVSSDLELVDRILYWDIKACNVCQTKSFLFKFLRKHICWAVGEEAILVRRFNLVHLALAVIAKTWWNEPGTAPSLLLIWARNQIETLVLIKKAQNLRISQQFSLALYTTQVLLIAGESHPYPTLPLPFPTLPIQPYKLYITIYFIIYIIKVWMLPTDPELTKEKCKRIKGYE